MAVNKKLMMIILGPHPGMSSKKEEAAEKAGKKGYPKDSAKEEAMERKMKPMKGKGGMR